MSKSVKEMLTDAAESILDLIENGYERQEREDWDRVFMPLQNAATKHRYSGSNVWTLMGASRAHGFSDPRWMTLKQCNSLKDSDGNPGRIKAGSKGTLILRPFPIKKKVPLGEEESASDIPAERLVEEDDATYKLVDMIGYRAVHVFNAAQTTLDLSPMHGLTKREWMGNEFFEKFLQASEIAMRHDGGTRAYYNPNGDCIHMPQKSAFAEADQYYASLLHEFFHATGHGNREDRLRSKTTGDAEYALEELRAELFSVACVQVFGLEYPLEKQAGYLDGWRKRIEDGDAKVILRAAADVERVMQTILDVAEGKQPKPDWFPRVDFSSTPTPLKDAFAAQAVQEAQRTAEEARKDPVELCRAVLPPEQFALLEKGLAESNHDFFRERIAELGRSISCIPPLYAQEPFGDEAVVFVRFISADDKTSYYITELDPNLGKACGCIVVNGDVGDAQLREIDLEEIRIRAARMDESFAPRAVMEVLAHSIEQDDRKLSPRQDDEEEEYDSPAP
ncbi:MAG: ssDNA-binding domain-containing protein [Deltaproteobacteria bacterium]|jgi:antirestriction protein ArdC|nr:ssDNA-binding domain-containing protein [Deltaproteobacteria bacterium]